MNREVELLEYLINKDYQELIFEDGFNPDVAFAIVQIRYQNGVYNTDNRLFN